MARISLSRRLRQTPFSDGVEAAGVQSYTVYNRMRLPTFFESFEADYHHLKKHVQIWDVACERQVEIVGPDAGRFIQFITPRDMSKKQDDQCFYVPMVDQDGGMLNDPVALQVDEDRWWISIADSDLLFWVKGLALGLEANVRVHEPDVSPLAIQGPDADELASRVFGNQVQDIRFFRYKRLEFRGKQMIVARSGYSKQGGFEVYVEGCENGMPLWNAFLEAGRDLNVRAGCPNYIERIESGLLSYGNDMTMMNTPHECGLGKFCNRPSEADYVGKAALEAEAARGPKQQIRPLMITGEAVPPITNAWPLLKEGEKIGQITSAVWSPGLLMNVAIGMVEKDHWQTGNRLSVVTPTGPQEAEIAESFWG